MIMTETDRIESRLSFALHAPVSGEPCRTRKSSANGFGVKLEGGFAEGATIRGNITNPGYEHMTMDLMIERSTPKRTSPTAGILTPSTRKSITRRKPTTLVEFRLEEINGETSLTIGRVRFDRIPAARGAPRRSG